jgi:predicted secreted protein
MAIINGTDLKVYDSSTNILIAFAQSASITINMDTRDISNKESGGFAESLEGQRNFEVSVDGAYAWTNAAGSALTNGSDDLVLKYMLDAGSNTREAFTLRWGNTAGATGDTYYQGSAFLTSFSATGGTEDTATYSMTFTGTGAITQTVS